MFRFNLRNLGASFALAWGLTGSAGAVPLTSQDQTNLTASLTTLSSGWVQADVERANSILIKPEYTAADWQTFFAGYFGANLLTADLYNYLQYPVLS